MMTVGGPLDPAFPDADIFVGAPEPARVPPGRACAVARRYVDLINAGDYAGVAALYADDASLLEPMRPGLHGRAQIDEFYSRRIGGMKPRLVATSILGDDVECMIALALRVGIDGQERYALVSVDHFQLDAQGRILSMTAFARPPRTLPSQAAPPFAAGQG